MVAAVAALALSGVASGNHTVTYLQSTGPAGGNAAIDANVDDSSDDGTRVFFNTAEPLVTADTDTQIDLYERSGGVTTLVSTGPTGGNGAFDAQFGDVSKDGKRVFFETDERLTSADTDSNRDVYERSGGVTTLVSTGPAGGNGALDAFFRGISQDGLHVYFVAYESLVSEDQDSDRKDLYERSGGVTSLVSTGTQNANALLEADFDGVTPDGSSVFFHTDAALTAADTDTMRDVYQRQSGTTTLVSTSTYSANGPRAAFFDSVGASGSPVFFDTSESLAPSDTDNFRDVYQRAGGVTEHVSTGPSGGNGPYDSNYSGSSGDGSRVFFVTRDPLVASDTDGQCDDAAGQPVVPCIDVYERAGGVTNLISTGSQNANSSDDASFSAISLEGGRVFFTTSAALEPADTDSSAIDVYERTADVTTLVSTGPVSQNGPHAASLVGISADGTRVFFATYEKETADDLDANWLDIYERAAYATTLISTGPAATNLPSLALFRASSLDGTRVFFQTEESLVSGDTDSVSDVYSREAPISGYPRPKGASPLRLSLVPAFQTCALPDRVHSPPLIFGSCSDSNTPYSRTQSQVLTLGTPDHNGLPVNSASYVKLVALVGTPGGPSDADLSAIIHINDVRCGPGGGAACPGGATEDFAGRLVLRTTVRLTDRMNGGATGDAATVQNFPLDLPVQCNATPTAEGGSCDTTTTVNSLLPGAIVEGKRAILEIGQMRVYDPGANGTGFDTGCPPTCGDGDETVFMRQGLFVP